MEDEKLEKVLAWAEELATLQENLGDRFDLVENKRGKFNLQSRSMVDDPNQKEIAILMEILNASEGNDTLLYAPRRTQEIAILDSAVANQLSNSAHSKLATRGMRKPAGMSREDRVKAAQAQAGMLGTGRDALTGAPISMLNFDAGHIKSNIKYPETANDYQNIRPQPSTVNRAGREAESDELVDRLLNGYIKRLRGK